MTGAFRRGMFSVFPPIHKQQQCFIRTLLIPTKKFKTSSSSPRPSVTTLFGFWLFQGFRTQWDHCRFDFQERGSKEPGAGISDIEHLLLTSVALKLAAAAISHCWGEHRVSDALEPL